MPERTQTSVWVLARRGGRRAARSLVSVFIIECKVLLKRERQYTRVFRGRAVWFRWLD